MVVTNSQTSYTGFVDGKLVKHVTFNHYNLIDMKEKQSAYMMGIKATCGPKHIVNRLYSSS